MRYAWSQEDAYRRAMGPGGLGLRLFRKSLRRWDVRTAAGVDHFLANSQNVANRIRETYSRESTVVYPPVDTAFYTPDREPREDFYLIVGAMAPNKRFDQAIEAMRLLPERWLVVIGTGQTEAYLRRHAPSNVTFLGWQSDEVVRDHYRRCRALLFPGEEDFGIVPVEAMACGCPVIAYGAGGALETVVDLAAAGPGCSSGLCYQPQTPRALADAIHRFESHQGCFDREWIVWHASRFSTERFCQEFGRIVADLAAGSGMTVPVLS
jgi:glycosyltransferase involved in cell wall biosynthesis